ncbi:collectrin-like [Erethizon dorsatum]
MLWLLFFLVTAIRAELCQPDAENAFKVRLSIRTALGDKAYVWDTNEEYLFRAMVAFSMRKIPNRETTERLHISCSHFLLPDQPCAAPCGPAWCARPLLLATWEYKKLLPS